MVSYSRTCKSGLICFCLFILFVCFVLCFIISSVCTLEIHFGQLLHFRRVSVSQQSYVQEHALSAIGRFTIATQIPYVLETHVTSNSDFSPRPKSHLRLFTDTASLVYVVTTLVQNVYL